MKKRTLEFTVMRFEAYAQKNYCGRSLWWPTWKTRLTWKSESYAHFVGTGSVPVFLAMVWQCPAAHRSLIILGTCCKIPDLAHGVFPMFPVLKDHSPGCRFTWRNRGRTLCAGVEGLDYKEYSFVKGLEVSARGIIQEIIPIHSSGCWGNAHGTPVREASRSRFEPGISHMQVRSVTTGTTWLDATSRNVI